MRIVIHVLALGLVFGLTLGTPFVDDAAAVELPSIGGRATSSSGDGGDGGNGGNGGDGGVASVRDLGNASANATSSVTVGDITTGDVRGHDVIVDAQGATDPVVVSLAGAFPDSGVDIFAPSGNAQAGTTGGNGNSADSSGGEGGAGGAGGDSGNATARGGGGGNPQLTLTNSLICEGPIEAGRAGASNADARGGDSGGTGIADSSGGDPHTCLNNTTSENDVTFNEFPIEPS